MVTFISRRSFIKKIDLSILIELETSSVQQKKKHTHIKHLENYIISYNNNGKLRQMYDPGEGEIFFIKTFAPFFSHPERRCIKIIPAKT